MLIGDVAHVDAIEQNLSFIRVIEAHQQFDEGRLTCSVFSDNRELFPGIEHDVHMFERIAHLPRIPKGYVPKFNGMRPCGDA